MCFRHSGLGAQADEDGKSEHSSRVVLAGLGNVGTRVEVFRRRYPGYLGTHDTAGGPGNLGTWVQEPRLW